MKLIFKRVLFYIASFTWGIVMSLIGGIVMILPFGKLHTFHGRIYKTYKKGWGGLELGCFFICAEDCQSDTLRGHECGHGIQNIIWGPLFPFVIAIPSAIRYWYIQLKYYRKGKFPPFGYDDIWFEGQATEWGKKYILTDRI